MSSFRKPSPARSLGGEVSKRRLPPRRSRSLNSRTSSNASVRLSAVIQEYNERNGTSFVLSPLRRNSVLTDNTNIEEPRRKSWWQMLDENSREFIDIGDNKETTGSPHAEQKGIMEELDIEILSQERRNFTLDLPDSSDNESINSIVLPQRKLFTEKHKPQQKFGLIKNNRATLAKINKSTTKDVVLPPPKNLLQNISSKPIFPEALLMSPNTSATDSPQTQPDPQPKVRHLFGHTQGIKRKNMLANYNFIIESDNEANISDIQPKIVGFQKKPDGRLALRKRSSISSNTTDIELDDWRQLPSSTMVENQLEAILGRTTPNKERLSKLSEEAKESVAGSSSDTVNKTKQLNKSASRNKSTEDKENSSNKSIDTNPVTKNKNFINQPTEELAEDNIIDNNMEIDNENLKSNELVENELGNEIQQVGNSHKSDINLEGMNQSKDDIQVANYQEYEQKIVNDDQHEQSEQENEDVDNAKLEVESNVQKIVCSQDIVEHINNQANDEENGEQNNKIETDNNDQQMEKRQEVDGLQIESKLKNDEKEVESDQGNETPDEENNAHQIESRQENEEQEVEVEENDSVENEPEEDEQEVESDSQEMESDPENNEQEADNDEQDVESDSQEMGSDPENNEQEVESEKEDNDDQHAESVLETDEQEAESDQENYDQAVESEQEIEGQDEETEEDSDIHQKESDKENNDQEMESDKENNDQEMESDKENNDQEMESDKEGENEQESDADAIDGTPDVSHDTTGKRYKDLMPEGVLDYNPNDLETSVHEENSRKSKQMNMSNPAIGNLQSESMRSSFGARNSSAEGSGWDSHRTTRKTLRQTFGKDFTIRKSLRTLVMEKSAKRQTLHNKGDITANFPQANSTEIHEETGHYSEDVCNDSSPPEMPVEMYLEKVMQRKMESRMKMKEQVKNSLLKVPTRDPDNLFKVPAKPMFSRRAITKSAKPKGNTVKSAVAFEGLPEEFKEDMKYKPPKRFQPNDASWITKRLYKYLETKLEAKYGYKKRVRAEKVVETIYAFTRGLKRQDVAAPSAVEGLKRELASLNIVHTHFDFYEFFYQFLPREVIIKVVPDVANRIPVPHGVFDNIIT